MAEQQLKKGWVEEFMIATALKEASYDAGVVMTAPTASSMKRFDSVAPAYEDVLDNDKEQVTNTEHGTDQSIVEQRVKMTYVEPKTKPHTLAALAGLVLGDITSVKDGAFTGYTHTIVPVAVGTEIPSTQVEHLKGGIQKAFTGIKGSSLKISAEAGGFISVEAELMGSGSRDASATAFPAIITEDILFTKNCSVWLESGTNISISPALVQGAEDISSATPEDIGVRFKNFEFTFNNNPEEIVGFGGAGKLQDIDYGRRSVEFKTELIFKDATELDYYLNQDALAIEIDCKGALIDAGGVLFWGFQLVISRFKLKTASLPDGDVNSTLAVTLEGDVQDDGTNDVCKIEVYNEQAAYYA